MVDEQRKVAVCMWCHSHCIITALVRNGKLVGVEAPTKDEVHGAPFAGTPFVTRCRRISAAAEWLYHPDQLKYPLRRAGERGEGKWSRISWDKALDEIAEKLKVIREKYGAEAVALQGGTYRNDDFRYGVRFMNLFGSPNQSNEGHICWGFVKTLANAICGLNLNWPLPFETEATRCTLRVGNNPHQGRQPVFAAIVNAKRRGTKLIVIDPRETETARRADIWLQLRPGTDCALLMGMINVIINEKLYDKEFVDKWCYGFDKLVERVREYPPEKVAEITWVPPEQIVEAARMFATNKPAHTYAYMGLQLNPNSIEGLHATFILSAICGNIDVRGGDPAPLPGGGIISEYEVTLADRLTREQKDKQLGSDRFKLLSWNSYDLIQEGVERVWGRRMGPCHQSHTHTPSTFRAIITGKPYPVKALITQTHNPMLACANTKLVYRALKSLDLHVVMDFWLTPSAELADYVLPCASWFERPHLDTVEDTVDAITVGQAPVPPLYERRTDYDLWRGLGLRLGQEEYWPWKTLEEAFDWELSPLGLTVKKFLAQKGPVMSVSIGYEKHKQRGFATPTGKFELYSTILEKLGYDPLPRYYEPAESPINTSELAKEYPLILITGARHQPFWHSEHRQIDSLRNQHPEPVIQINPEKAAELGINNDDWVWIETPRGRIRQKCQLFNGIDPRVVSVQHGWWFPELPGEEPWLHGVWESNANVLTDDDPDHCNKISGGWICRGLLCRVYKAKRY